MPALLLKGLLSFVFKYWQWILLAIVIAGAYFHYTGLVHERDKLKQQVVELQTANQICNDNNAKLESNIANMNKAIDKLSTVTTNQTNKIESFKKDVATRTDSIKSEVKKILAGQKPQTCEDSIKYLIDATKEYNKK